MEADSRARRSNSRARICGPGIVPGVGSDDTYSVARGTRCSETIVGPAIYGLRKFGARPRLFIAFGTAPNPPSSDLLGSRPSAYHALACEGAVAVILACGARFTRAPVPVAGSAAHRAHQTQPTARVCTALRSSYLRESVQRP